MVPNIPPGFANVTYHFTALGVSHSISTSHGIFLDESNTGLAAATISVHFKNGLMQDGARLSNTYSYLGLTLVANQGSGPMFIEEFSDPEPGTMIAQCLPPNCSLLVTKRTNFIGRHYRGRMFFPGGFMPESEVSTAGIVDTGVLAGHAVTLTAWLADLETSTYPMYLFHQYDDADPTPVLVQPTKVTSLVCAPLIATQRNRMR